MTEWPSDKQLPDEQRNLIADAKNAEGRGRQALVRAVIHLTNSQDRSARVLTRLTWALVGLTAILVVMTVVLVVLTERL